MRWVLAVAAGPFVAENRLQSMQAQELAVYRLSCPVACETLVPGPGVEPASPALQGRF